MAAKPSPITPSVLAWAVEQDGRPLADVARAVGAERRDVQAWIDGTSTPSIGEVTKLAGFLQRPRAFFFLPAPPAQSALPSGFRHPPGADAREVPQTVLLAARRAKRLQQAVASTLAETQELTIPIAAPNASPVRTAGVVRTWLGIPNEETWSDERQAMQRWRSALEDVGVLVFMLKLGKDQVRGFASWDERAPLIVANVSSVGPPARIFTLGHELGHLVRREQTACLEPAGGMLVVDSAVERWCEEFAAALVMPETEVRILMRERRIGRLEAGLNEVSAMLRRFRVSARAAALRLIELGFAENNLYGHVLRVFVPKPRPDGDKIRSQRRHRARLSEYGQRTVENVVAALPARDAMSVLRIDTRDLRALADEVPGVVAI